MGIEQATRVTVQEVMDEVQGQVNGIIPMNPKMDDKLNSIKSKIGEHMRPRLRDICAFLELKDASKDVKSNDFNHARSLVRRIRDAIQMDIRDFKKRPTDTKRSYYVGQKSLTVDDNSKKAPSNTKTHRNDNEVALHMTLTQHLKGMDSLNSALGNLKQEESEYLAQMTDHVQDGHADAFDDALTEQAIMEALKQDSLELAQSEVLPSTEPVKQTEKKKVSFVDNQDVAIPKEPAKSASAVSSQVSNLTKEKKQVQPAPAQPSASQEPATDIYDPYKDPINGPAILAAINQDPPPVEALEDSFISSHNLELPSSPWALAERWGLTSINPLLSRQNQGSAHAEVLDSLAKDNINSISDNKMGYILGSGKRIAVDSEPLSKNHHTSMSKGGGV